MVDLALAARLRLMAANLVAEAVAQETLPRTITFSPAPGSRTELVAGQGVPYQVTIKTTGISKLLVSAVSAKPGNPFLGAVQGVATSGVATVTVTLTEDKSFVKAIDANDTSSTPFSRDSDPVTLKLAPAPVVAPPVVAPPSIPAGVPAGAAAGLAQARAFRDLSCFNVNIERERFVENIPITAELLAYWRDVGVGGVRAFSGAKLTGVDVGGGQRRSFWDYQVGSLPTKEQFNRFLPKLRQLTEAKFATMFDVLDLTEIGDTTGANGMKTEAWLAQAAGWMREWALDPAYFVPGPVNEWVGESNEVWGPVRERYHGILRRGMGDRYILGMAPGYWGACDNYLGAKYGVFNPTADAGTIFFTHAYDRRSTQGWVDVQKGFDAWSAAHGNAVVMWGEIGPGGLYDGKDFLAGDGGWVEHINRQNPALAKSVPNLWAITTGDWTMNRAFNDGRFWTRTAAGWEPEIHGAVKAASAANRRARGL